MAKKAKPVAVESTKAKPVVKKFTHNDDDINDGYDAEYVESLVTTEDFQAFRLIDKDLKKSAEQMPRAQARYLVDQYYQFQKARITAAAQIREAEKINEPIQTLQYMFETYKNLEATVQKMLGIWAKQWKVGAWLQSICGIGPVISAGLLAHIDIRKAPTAGCIWRFAGLDPTLKWEKKTKRPYNAELKVLCVFKAGECFVKVQNNTKDVYGKIYRTRKDWETDQNERGAYAALAKSILESKNFRDDTDAKAAYLEGKLPKAHIHARARRYAVKIFLSHVQDVMYRDYFDEAPLVPFIMKDEGGTHRHFIKPPAFDQKGKSLKEMLPPLPPLNER